ncbi:MAG: acetate kinase [Acidobacteriota bacterium]|nr:acetate kinase [Acidobacteriota bacterium]
MKILVLNSGSSSQKSFLYELGAFLPESRQAPLWEGKIEWHGDRASLRVWNSTEVIHEEKLPLESRAKATEQLLGLLTGGDTKALTNKSEIAAVGHRIVNGGRDYTEPTVITPEVNAAIRRASFFAPLHNRVELEGIDLIEKLFGDIPQVAVFDTAFHSQLPDAAAVYAGPYEWLQQGIRRFGFHGINHEYCAKRAAQMLGKDLVTLKLVTCHLGNGCSLAAIQNGKSIDTTMGFTPLEGLMMGTRSGSVDPGILTYLMREQKVDGQQLDDLLNKKSGLLGISGISGDMREIVSEIKRGTGRAKLAFDIFVHRLQAGIGSMAAALGGIDALVFTAGIGENSSEVREAACANLGFLGIQLDSAKNAGCRPDQDISPGNARAKTLVIQAQEDWAIACQSWKLLVGQIR